MARILIVDDDLGNADSMQMVLEEEQFEVWSIYHAKMLQQAIRSFNPHVIVMDILLDGADGRILCNALKKDVATRHIPILLITAMLEFQARALINQADILMFKPFDCDKLAENVRTLIARTNAHSHYRSDSATSNLFLRKF